MVERDPDFNAYHDRAISVDDFVRIHLILSDSQIVITVTISSL